LKILDGLKYFDDSFPRFPGKIRRKYGNLSGTLLLVSCERVPEAGLGISLAGNRDREKNSTFVLGVKVQCPLTVRAGDELLEVGIF
uniref:MoeA_C domain-containing protein n=1 Tax=Angiostrongylus costaricensis TaxID=334426 RepID=A0A0R3PIP9_ANGCS